ncbi:hypothetical protein FRC06_006307, partial [Ceratobasidium sp. 370]
VTFAILDPFAMQKLTIKKGSKPTELEPFTLVLVPGDVVTLQQLRNFLTTSKRMVDSDVFLTQNMFPVHKGDEVHHNWADLVRSSESAAPSNSDTTPCLSVLSSPVIKRDKLTPP